MLQSQLAKSISKLEKDETGLTNASDYTWSQLFYSDFLKLRLWIIWDCVTTKVLMTEWRLKHLFSLTFLLKQGERYRVIVCVFYLVFTESDAIFRKNVCLSWRIICFVNNTWLVHFTCNQGIKRHLICSVHVFSNVRSLSVLLIMPQFACVARSEAVYLSERPYLHSHPLILPPDRSAVGSGWRDPRS